MAAGSQIAARTLIASEAATTAAQISAGAAVLSLLVGAIGLFAIWRSLRDARRANELAAASNSANAAATARATQSDRAYVFLHTTKKDRAPDRTPTRIYGPIFKNFGRTPAFMLSLKLNAGFFDRAPDPTLAVTEYIMPQPHVIPVDGEWPYRHYFQIGEMDRVFEQWQAGRRELWLYGSIVYRDVYGVEHHTWFSRVFSDGSFVFGKDPEHEDLQKWELNGYD